MIEMDESDCLAWIAVAETGVALSDEQLDALLACLGHSRKLVQRRAAHILAGLPGRRADLLAILASKQARQRWGAAYALSLCEAPALEATAVLFECLGSSDGDVRWAARDILLRLQAALDLAPLLLEVAHSGSPAQRKMAAYCLRDLATRASGGEAAMLRLLHDPDSGVRIAAMACLERIATDRAATADAVARLVHDDEPGVRRAAAATLGSIGEATTAALAALDEASRDSDPSLRRAAEGARRKLG